MLFGQLVYQQVLACCDFLQTCEGRPDKASCQVKCGDLYSDSTVQKFDTCAITENKCVPQIPVSPAWDEHSPMPHDNTHTPNSSSLQLGVIETELRCIPGKQKESPE